MQPLDQCPAIVLGDGETALGTIRSLRRAGIPVAFSSDRSDMAGWSKPYMPLNNWPQQELSSAALEQWLESTQLRAAVLMPCSDPWVQSVSRLSDQICQRFRRWTPDSEVVDTIVNKNRFRSVLEFLDLPHPRSYFLERDMRSWQIPDNMFESAFLKPHDSRAFVAEFGVKGVFVSDAENALRQCQVAWDKGLELMLQEYVPGPPTNHYFVDGFRQKHGRATQFLARQRLRMFPADFGNSTDMLTVPLSSVDPALETLYRLFDHTGFHGIFSAEFKLDPRDGPFKIIEINGRPWWFVDYADRGGLHVCSAAYCDALDLEIPAQEPYKLGKRGTYPVYDWHAFRNSDDRRVESFLVMVVNWLRSYQPVFCWSDPMPALVNFYRKLGNALRGRSA